MPPRKPARSAADALAQHDLSQFLPENAEPRPGRSKRGLPKSDPSIGNLCFRIEKERHKAIRVYCAEHEMEVGEFFDELLRKAGF